MSVQSTRAVVAVELMAEAFHFSGSGLTEKRE